MILEFQKIVEHYRTERNPKDLILIRSLFSLLSVVTETGEVNSLELLRKMLEVEEIAQEERALHWAFYPEQNTVIINRETITLTNLPYSILLYLFKRKHQFVSKAELTLAFWKEDSQKTRAFLATQIAKIRSKIESESDSPKYLKSILALGYRLEPDEIP